MADQGEQPVAERVGHYVTAVSALAFLTGYAYDLGFFIVIGRSYLDVLTISDYVATALDGIVILGVVAIIVALSGPLSNVILKNSVLGPGRSLEFPKWTLWALLGFLVVVSCGLYGVAIYFLGFQGSLLSFQVIARAARSEPWLSVGYILYMACGLLLIASALRIFLERSTPLLRLIFLSGAVSLYFGVICAYGLLQGYDAYHRTDADVAINFRSEAAASPQKAILIFTAAAGVIVMRPADRKLEFIRWDVISSLEGL